jgi:hypothetical protein
MAGDSIKRSNKEINFARGILIRIHFKERVSDEEVKLWQWKIWQRFSHGLLEAPKYFNF